MIPWRRRTILLNPVRKMVEVGISAKERDNGDGLGGLARRSAPKFVGIASMKHQTEVFSSIINVGLRGVKRSFRSHINYQFKGKAAPVVSLLWKDIKIVQKK